MAKMIFSEIYQNRERPLYWYQRLLRVLSDTFRGFIEDECYLKASALTFYSLLSIVPVLAVLFGIAKGFGFEKNLEFEINQHFIEQKELIEKLIQFAYSWLDTVRGGLIAGVGAVTLLWSVFGLLNNIETALNSIWKTRKERSYLRKINDYLAAIVIGPILFVTSSSITVYLSSRITQTAHEYLLVEAVSPLLFSILKLFPFFLSSFLFVFLYLLLPNTKVYFRSAFIAGCVAGSAFQLWQWIYIKFQLIASSYGTIYGSFAALPLFLIWLQVSWLILLAGAELAYELENDVFVPNRKQTIISVKAAALLITFRCIEAFLKGLPPLTDQKLGNELGISLYHLQNIIEVLKNGKILSSIILEDGTIGYHPARAIDTINFTSVCEAVEQGEQLSASIEHSSAMAKIQAYLIADDKERETSPQNRPLYQAIGSDE